MCQWDFVGDCWNFASRPLAQSPTKILKFSWPIHAHMWVEWVRLKFSPIPEVERELHLFIRWALLPLVWAWEEETYTRGRWHWLRRAYLDSAELGLSHWCGHGKPMVLFVLQQCARGLQGGSPGHLHFQVKCWSLVFAQCNPLSKHVETSMHDLALLEYRAWIKVYPFMV